MHKKQCNYNVITFFIWLVAAAEEVVAVQLFHYLT